MTAECHGHALTASPTDGFRYLAVSNATDGTAATLLRASGRGAFLLTEAVRPAGHEEGKAEEDTHRTGVVGCSRGAGDRPASDVATWPGEKTRGFKRATLHRCVAAPAAISSPGRQLPIESDEPQPLSRQQIHTVWTIQPPAQRLVPSFVHACRGGGCCGLRAAGVATTSVHPRSSYVGTLVSRPTSAAPHRQWHGQQAGQALIRPPHQAGVGVLNQLWVGYTLPAYTSSREKGENYIVSGSLSE